MEQTEPKILLTEDTASVEPRLPGKAIVVCHKDYAPPLAFINSAIDFAEFKPKCRRLVQGLDSLVFVGLNKAMTPGNRTEDVWELLFNQTPNLYKVSVDVTPFVSEPWRAWFHFGLVGAKYRDYTYSYIAESHHKSYLDGLREDDPFAIDEFLRWGRWVYACSYRQWFDLTVEVVPVAASAHAEYAELKQAVFDEEVSVNRIIDRLSVFATSVCHRRKVPLPQRLFCARRHHIVATDLAVDKWLVGRLRHLAGLVNGVAQEFCR